MSARGKYQHGRLTDRVVRQARPGRHGDGHGLHLYVRPSGTRSWVQRLVVDGVRLDRGLGAYPLVTLAEARAAALENRRVARSGGDPFASRVRKAVPTLREVAEQVIAAGRPSWTGAHTELDWRRGLDKFVFPRLGDRRVDQVTLEDVIAVVQPEWNGRGSTGYLLRQRIDAILRWAVVKKYRLDNPAQQALDLLPKVRREPDHRPSLSYTKVAAAMTALRASSAPAVIKDLVLFIVLTAARLSEATKAPWSEIDFDAVVKKYRLDNPAQQALDLLPKVRREPDHRPSLSYTKVAAAMTALRASSAPAVIKDLVLFIVLTAARLSEATKAPWSEIDFDDPVWSLPAGRMKAGRKHDVPLSGQALDLLQHVRGRGEFGPFVFCLRSSRGRLRPVTGETLNYWLRKLDLRDSEDRFVVTHGFRATFTDARAAGAVPAARGPCKLLTWCRKLLRPLLPIALAIGRLLPTGVKTRSLSARN